MSSVSFIHLAINISFLYGVFVVAGGIVGYKQAGSMMSLYAGTLAGTAAMLASLICRRGYLNVGLKLLTAVSLGLTIVFMKRFQATGAFLPSGFMTINSGAVLFVSILASKELANPNREASDKTE